MAGLTELPSTEEASLGNERKDLITFGGQQHRAGARLLNKVRVYLIQIGEMLGLADGSTPGSLMARVANLEASPGGGGPHPAKFIVGNALAGDIAADCHFLDPGDGTGIEAALAAAAGGGDVFIRAGAYGYGSAAPFFVPAGCVVTGAGRSQTLITGSLVDRTVFSLSPGSALRSLTIVVPTGTPGAMSGTDVVTAANASLEDVYVDATAVDPSDATESLECGIRITSAASLQTVSRCRVDGVYRVPTGGTPFTGIDVVAAAVAIDTCYVYIADRGISVAGSATVESCVLETIVTHGIRLHDALQSRVAFCRATVGHVAVSGTGISVTGASGQNVIAGNTLTVSSGGTTTGIYLDSTAAPTQGTNTVTGNVVDVGGSPNVAIEATVNEAGSVIMANPCRGGLLVDAGTANVFAHNNHYVTP